MRIPLLLAATKTLQKGPHVPISAGEWRVIANQKAIMRLWKVDDSPHSPISVFHNCIVQFDKDSKVMLQVDGASSGLTVYLERVA